MWFYADSKMAGTPKPISPLIGGSPKPMVMPPNMVSPKLIGRPPAVTTMKINTSPKPMMPMMTPRPISPMLIKPTMPTSPKPMMPLKKPISPLPNMPTKMISIPKVKYTLNQKPVVFEKVCKQVGYEKVPIQYEFEKQVFPVKVVKKQGMCKSPCMKGKFGGVSPKMGGKFSPKMGGGSPKLQQLLFKLKDKMSPGKQVISEQLKMKFSPKHKHHGHKHHGHGSPNMFKLPCAMKTSWHMNRSPCGKDKFMHLGSGKSCGSQSQSPKCGGGNCGGNWPRWQSSYVKTSQSPCMTAVTSNCNKKFCSQC
jgi:hypothetical protein